MGNRITPDEIEEAIRMVRGGDWSALAKLVTHFQPILHRFLTDFTRDFHRAEDATQDTFLRAWIYRESLRPEPDSFMSWLCRVGQNICRTMYRTSSAQQRSDKTYLQRKAAAAQDEAPDPSEAIAAEEDYANLIERVRSTVGPESAEIFIERGQSGKKLTDLAKDAGLQKKAVWKMGETLRRAIGNDPESK